MKQNKSFRKLGSQSLEVENFYNIKAERMNTDIVGNEVFGRGGKSVEERRSNVDKNVLT